MAHTRTVCWRRRLSGYYDGTNTVVPVQQTEGLNEIGDKRPIESVPPELIVDLLAD
jgi:hypothetical protein